MFATGDENCSGGIYREVGACVSFPLLSNIPENVREEPERRQQAECAAQS